MFQHEVMLFAAVGIAIGGIDDLVIDILFGLRWGWRRLTIYSRFRPMTGETLPPSERPGAMAVFVPAWAEADVIGAMLTATLRKWERGNYRLFVGVYPNDPATRAAVDRVAATDRRVIAVITPRAGPTTKADCLNSLWYAMLGHEQANGSRFKAVMLHDAEDVVHPDALRLLDRMTDRFDLVQLPVLPLVSQQSLWVAGHYCDEFAESHGKAMAVREAIGAAVPSAGVGCAFSRAALSALADRQGGSPFDPASLTEDYEIGLRIAEMGGTAAFVRMSDGRGDIICTREHFPETFQAAVKQKARWMIGISLSGWDRLGWHGGVAERWMRLRDRRAALAALILLAAYICLPLWGLIVAVQMLTGQSIARMSPILEALIGFNAALMTWRLLIRALFVSAAYGWRQGLLSVPRTFMANLIAIFAARRALGMYVGLLRGAPLVWDKTRHRFPAADTAEA